MTSLVILARVMGCLSAGRVFPFFLSLRLLRAIYIEMDLDICPAVRFDTQSELFFVRSVHPSVTVL